MKIFYYTATGNCLDVSKRIGGELYSIPQLLKENKLEFEDEAIGIICPTYMWSIPRIVVEFLEKAKFKTNYFFAVVTYGNIDGGATNHFVKIAKKNNLDVKYIKSLLTVDTALPLFDIEKQVSKLDKKKTEENLQQIVEDIHNRKTELNIGNSIKATFSDMSYKMQVSMEKNKYKQFKVEDHCIGCKTCSKVCPVNNITMENNRPKYDTHCIGCFSCTNNCPVNAIRVKHERSKARYRNKNVSVKEIIDSNNQN